MRTEQFERLYEEHAQPLLAFLVYRTGNRAVAEDVLADTFERALRARRRFDARRASEKTWLYAIALNVLRDHLRRVKAERRALERVGAPDALGADPAFDAIDERDRLAAALECLNPQEREAIALRYGADLTLREIARTIDEPVSTVEGRVYGGLRKLRAHLDEC